METPKVYAICDSNCRWETLTREQILTAIMQAVNEGTIGDIDSGFISTIKTINGTGIKFFYGTQNEYNALPKEQKANLAKFITDDETFENINSEIESILNGSNIVGRSRNSEIAESAKIASKALKADEAYKLKANLFTPTDEIIYGGRSYTITSGAGLYAFTFESCNTDGVGNGIFTTKIIPIDFECTGDNKLEYEVKLRTVGTDINYYTIFTVLVEYAKTNDGVEYYLNIKDDLHMKLHSARLITSWSLPVG